MGFLSFVKYYCALVVRSRGAGLPSRGGGGLGWLRVVEMKGSDGRGYAWRVLSSHVLLVVVVVPCVCEGLMGCVCVCGPHMHLEPFIHVNRASRSNDGAIEARRLAGDLEASRPRLPACRLPSYFPSRNDGFGHGVVWFTGLPYRIVVGLTVPRCLLTSTTRPPPSLLVPPNPDVLYVL